MIGYLLCALISKGRYWSSYNKNFDVNYNNELTNTRRLQQRIIDMKRVKQFIIYMLIRGTFLSSGTLN